MRVDNLIIALQEFPPETEVFLTDDFYGYPSNEVDRIEWAETKIHPVIDGKIVEQTIKVIVLK